MEKLKQRFWAKTRKTKSCWLWKGALDGGGYGTFHDGERLVKAHRFAYTIFTGEIPENLVLDHLCRVRHCVNPAHLEAVTQSVNTKRGDTGTKSQATWFQKGHKRHSHA